MMYDELYEYLLLNRSLTVPGIGTFLLERSPARLDFTDKLIYPPVFSIGIKESELSVDFSGRINDLVSGWKKKIDNGGIINWEGVGTIQKDDSGAVEFIAASHLVEDPVPAIRVLRERAEHSVRVGEDERTSTQMTEMLSETTDVKRSLWWAWAAAIGLFALIFLGWYFSENGVEPGSTANGKKLILLPTTATYTEVH